MTYLRLIGQDVGNASPSVRIWYGAMENPDTRIIPEQHSLLLASWDVRMLLCLGCY